MKKLSTHDPDMAEIATVPKRGSEWIADIREAMEALDAIQMPEKLRKTIFRCLSGEMVEASERFEEVERTRRDGSKWTPEELTLLSDLLRNRIAKTWSEEKNNILEASLKLHRSEKSVKRKAVELGCSKAVDYFGNNRD